jgi:glycine/D-amino acid oxidase-like deaminating enzyme
VYYPSQDGGARPLHGDPELNMDQHDVVIIGAGMGGLITGALLAALDNRKVLVLEKESEIGGRIISFGGLHGSYTEKEYRRLMQGAAGVHIVRSRPSVGEIITEHKLFENFILDSAWHGVSAGSRNRYSVLAKAFGKSIPTVNQVGLLVRHEGEFVELSEIVRSWPEESRREKNRVAAARFRLSAKESAIYDHVDIRTYMESMTSDKLVQDYYVTLARFQMCVNGERDASAGEWIRCNNMTSATGSHLTGGGGMGDVAGGFKNVAIAFAEVITENGGEIRTDARVRQVLIENHRAVGVEVEYGRHDRTLETIRTKTVISNLPMDTVHQIIPAQHFPDEMNQRLEHLQPIGGILAHICLSEPLEKRWPKGLFLAQLDRPQVRGGTPLMSYEQTSLIDPDRVLDGSEKVLLQTWLALWRRGPDEAHDRDLVDALIDSQMEFLRTQYPQFDDVVEWYMWVLTDREYGVAPTPGFIGDRRPPVFHPTIPNLFFTGDTVTQTDVGTSAAAHGAILCANAVTGRDFLTLLPEFMR